MKRFLLFLVYAVLFGGYAFAYDFSAVCESGQTLYYKITSNTEPYTIKVTYQIGRIVDNNWIGYSTYPTGNLTIPAFVTYNNKTYSVTSIGDDAFSGCSELTSVTIPNSVTNIGINAFYGCSEITSVKIPNSVTNIGGWAFRDCSGLTSVYYTGNIAEWCGISFDSQPLTYAHNLYINDQLVTDLVIPETITEIRSYAFSGASCLTSVTIPNSVTSIGGEAFSDCSGLTTINFNATNCTRMGDVFFLVFANCNANATINIGEGVTIIPDYAFKGLLVNGTLTIPNSITYIGKMAFYNCSNITAIYSLAVNPPMIESGSFVLIRDIPVVFVPCGCVSVYNDAENWNAFTNIHENPDCAGVDENEFAIIDLYPNPVINSLYINAEETICEIEIVNSMGRVVKIMEVNAENAVCDVEKLPDGVYMANVRFKNGYDNVYRKTFVKK